MLNWKIKLIDVVRKIEHTMHVKIYFHLYCFQKLYVMFPAITMYTLVHIKHKALIMHGVLVHFSVPWKCALCY